MPGDEVEFDGFVGNVVAVSTVNTVLENKDGKRLSIPNQDLLNQKYMTTVMGAPAKKATATKSPAKKTTTTKAPVKKTTKPTKAE